VSKYFPEALVALSALTGLIWLIDVLFFKKKRLAGVPEGEKAKEPIVVEYARSFFPVIFAVLVIRSFIAEPFRIPSQSMMPTLLVNDFILVNKFSYGLRLPVTDYKFLPIGEPARGDVVVFRFPKDPTQDYIKRVVGLPGDEVTYQDKRLWVNGVEVPAEPNGRYTGQGDGHNMTGNELKTEQLGDVTHDILLNPRAFRGVEGTFKVPDGHYFVMGDNRDNSEDSRYWGFVPERNLVGRAFLIWLNLDPKVDFGRVGTVIH
jgi:signal peptidase I